MNSVHQHYKNIEQKDNFNLTLTTEKKVLDVLECIDTSKAAGIDKISGRFLKDGANILVKPIAKICDISISSGLFPSDCKTAKLKSSYKTGSKTNHENFGPFLSYHWKDYWKFIERMVYDQVNNFLFQNDILYNF